MDLSTPTFEEFFNLNAPETASPFVRKNSRKWGANLTLKAAIIATFLLLIAFILSYFASFKPLSTLALCLVYFLAGVPALIESVEDLLDFDINIDILMTLAAFSSILIGSEMEGALLLVLFALSGSMEDAVTDKAKRSIDSLHKLSPTIASVIEDDGSLIERSVKEINVGTQILVKAGEIIPLDGKVISGTSSINLVHLTGENLPVTKTIGDEVAAGAENLEGALTLQVTRTSSDSSLAKIIELVTNAQDSKPKLQRWFDEFSRVYATSIIGLSAFFALSFPFLFSMPFLGMEGSIYRALAFLIAASPCALIIAMPIAYLSALSAAAKNGILLKGGTLLDALAKIKAVAFDKTGTLTTGKLSCKEIISLNEDFPLNEAISIAYALEQNAIHPIAKALVELAKSKNLKPSAIENFKAIPGYGLEGNLKDGTPVAIGHVNFIEKKLNETTLHNLKNKLKEIKKEGELIAVLLIEQNVFIFLLYDTPRENVKATIHELQDNLHLKTVMLTGDNEESAKRIASMLGLKEYYAHLTPEDKLKHVAALTEKEGLAMIGDGINDAPALARATVGICMGKVGSTSAMEAADIVLLHDDIEKTDWLIKKARQTKRVVRQNLSLAVGAIIIATIPSLAGFIPLWMAVLLHEGGTVLVGLNGLRLLKI